MIPLYRVIVIALTDKVLNNLNNLKTFYIHQVSCQLNKTLLTQNAWEDKNTSFQLQKITLNSQYSHTVIQKGL